MIRSMDKEVSFSLSNTLAMLLFVIPLSTSSIASSEERVMDPTKPVIGTLQSSEQQRSKDEKASNTGPVLQQLIGNKSQWIAIISGQSYKVGENGPGFKVLEINSEGVFVETAEESYWLLLNNSDVEIHEHNENKARVQP